MARIARRDTQIPIGAPGRIEALALRVDQDRGGGMMDHHGPTADLGQRCLSRHKGLRVGLAEHGQGVVKTQRKARIADPAADDMPIEPLGLRDHRELVIIAPHGFRRPQQQHAALAQGEVEQ